MLKMVVAALILILAVILYTVYLFLKKNFNGLSWEEIVFHLKVPMKGTSNEMILDYFRTYGIPMASGVCLAIGISVVSYMMFSGIAGSIMLVAAIVLLIAAIYSILASFDTFGCLVAQRSESDFIEKEAVEVTPELLHFPEKKRNLIYIFLESFEQTFASAEYGGFQEENLIPNLTKLQREKGSTYFSEPGGYGMTEMANCSWTMASMVAQTSGIPLSIPLAHNDYDMYDTFLPGVTTLGQILEKEGDQQELLIGSEAAFAGTDHYFEQHGNYAIRDYDYAIENGWIPEDYYEWWGFEDEKLFAFAKEELNRLYETGEPFNLTMATMDTHCVEGYTCELCEDEYENPYYNVISCSNRQLSAFVDWIKEQPFAENTTVVLCGDHLTMDAAYSDSVDEDFHRTDFNVIINAAAEAENPHDRVFCALDLFPTTLAALGVEIPGNRLGLGANLFSDEPTLCESMGTEELADQIKQTNNYYNKHFLYGKNKA